MAPVHPDILAALTAGIQSEVASYVFYREVFRRYDDDLITETLRILAEEEKKHFHFLEQQYDSLIRSEKWISTADIMKQDGLPEINEDMTEEHRELIDKVEKASGLREILDIAYDLETAARDLYRGAAEQANTGEAVDTFEYLARFEESHMRLINSMLDKLDD
ncbi:MAG: ferritin family protein [Candidatus Zixiibacteriota bacterium]|nr:MAG: ferritin family protein [candidate division Zixibacteria bacterium]